MIIMAKQIHTNLTIVGGGKIIVFVKYIFNVVYFVSVFGQ